ncbi:hypothetical protein EJB05_08630, partial [Eragrostis curvula]
MLIMVTWPHRIIFIPLFHGIFARGRFSMPAPLLTWITHPSVDLKVVFLHLLAFEAVLLIDNLRTFSLALRKASAAVWVTFRLMQSLNYCLELLDGKTIFLLKDKGTVIYPIVDNNDVFIREDYSDIRLSVLWDLLGSLDSLEFLTGKASIYEVSKCSGN